MTLDIVVHGIITDFIFPSFSFWELFKIFRLISTRYNNIFEEDYINIHNRYWSSNNSIANTLTEKYKGIYLCDSSRLSRYYYFDAHNWHITDGNGCIFETIRSQMEKEAYILSRWVLKKSEISISERNIVSKVHLRWRMHPVILNIKEKIVKSLGSYEFDQNLDLLGFENGVYDLRTGIFRPGHSSDYICAILPISYHEYNLHSSSVGELVIFLENVFPDPDIRQRFMDVYSNSFSYSGKTINWVGSGGKTVMLMLMTRTFGQLSIITENYPPNTAYLYNSLNEAPPVRHVFRRPENVTPGVMISDNASYWGRNLFEIAKEIHPICTTTWVLDNPLTIIDDRMVEIPFESAFRDIYPNTRAEQLEQKIFPVDSNISETINRLRQPFIWLLLQNRKRIHDSLEV